MAEVPLLVNGVPVTLPAEPPRSLLLALRAELGLTGAKPGCGEGACGACTVLLDGEPAAACQVPLADAAGRAVLTIEGLTPREGLHPVQEAFAEVGALQCGYCTPGMVLATAALLARDPDPTPQAVREALDGHLCRCHAYLRIQEAARRAAARLRASGQPALPREPTPVVRGDPVATAWPRPARPWDLTPPEARRYFDVLPPGLVVVLRREATAAPGRWASPGPGDGPWLHVGGAGRITAFVGKVEVGQDTTTALALLVAEELRVAPESVDLVLGDTDTCPWDAGTFGSRSMPEEGPRLQGLAARAREELIALAAARLGLPAEALEARDGAVHRRPAGGAGTALVAYGDLVAGLERVVAVPPPPPDLLTAPAAWRVAGRPARSRAAVPAVTGRRRFPSDLVLPGMRYARILRGPARGARLRELDVRGALEVPGAELVQEGDLVAVLAEHPAVAAEALRRVQAVWDVPAGPGPEGLADFLRSHPLPGEPGWGGPYHEEEGDVDRALAEAPVRVDATYQTAFLAHAPLETRAALAAWEGDPPRLVVWTGTQRPFGVRAELAQALGVPEERIRVVVPPTGSGFGGRHSGQAAVEAARLARRVGRPVLVHWTRREEFQEGYLRPAAVVDVAAGASPTAGILAWDFTDWNAGAPGIALPYRSLARRIRFVPTESPLAQGSYRALAATANAFARESHVDELAWRLGVDPVAFRRAHLADDRLRRVLEVAAERIGWRGPVGDLPGQGFGVAVGLEKGGRVATAAEVRVRDGVPEVVRLVTAFECGAIVHPAGLENQVQGATLMALGGALFEAVGFRGPEVQTASFGSYRVPRFRDVPEVEVVLLDRRDLPPAGGGETPMIAVAPAVANALRAATGRRLHHLPLLGPAYAGASA